MMTKGGNQLLYVTKVNTQAASAQVLNSRNFLKYLKTVFGFV